MSVDLEPMELGFKRPFNHEVSQILRIRNPHSDPVAFKVKTTAPKQYCVRPNSGRIDPGSHVEVQVLLQAMKEDPPSDAKCRDKFLVQSVAVPGEKDLSNIPSVWSQIEQTAKSSIQEKKIRVVFLPRDDMSSPAASQTPAKANGVNHPQSTPASAPTPEAVTPHVSSTPAVGAVSKTESKPEGSRSLGDAIDSAQNPTVQRQSTQGSGGVAIPTSMDDVKVQLAEANATIARLRKQMEDQPVLRRRNDRSGDGKGPSSSGQSNLGLVQQQAAAAGVPVQIVAGLCLICFLLAYFFF